MKEIGSPFLIEVVNTKLTLHWTSGDIWQLTKSIKKSGLAVDQQGSKALEMKLSSSLISLNRQRHYQKVLAIILTIYI